MQTVLSLVEARIGIPIRREQLSPRAQRRVDQLQAVKDRLDGLEEGVEVLDRRRSIHLMLLFASIAFGLFGVVLPLTGLIQGSLADIESIVSFLAGAGLLVLVYFMRSIVRRLREMSLQNLALIADLSADFDMGLENVSHDVIASFSTRREAPVSSKRFDDHRIREARDYAEGRR